MRVISLLAGFALLSVVLLDAFQTIILPRRPSGRLRVTRLFFLATWPTWRYVTSKFRSRATREQSYSIYGPFSLLVLFVVWAFLLTAGFGLVFFGLRIAFHDNLFPAGGKELRFLSCLYVSGTTLFTLGLGDVTPQSHVARLLTVMEGGTGFGFIALVIGYLPVLYAAFSRREVTVALLDSRAGSPPTAAELLRRHDFDGGRQALGELLSDWERWCAEMLETHISYPILCFYRSQHDNQSWLAALVAVLDACALRIAMLDGRETRQAQLTFAIGRHTLVDLVHVFRLEKAEQRLRDTPLTRLSDDELGRLCAVMEGTDLSPCSDFESRERLRALRLLYEPYACALADFFRLTVPPWVAPPMPAERKPDAWTVMAGLRSPQVLADRLAQHVSEQSTAMHLEAREKEEV